MSNLTVNQRNQMERSSLDAGATRIRRGSERGAAIYNVVALVVGAALAYAAPTVIEGWSQWLVLGAIVLTTVGFMIAVSPTRRA